MEKKIELLPGVFTVNAEGKKIRFTKSNVIETNGDLLFFNEQYKCLGENNGKGYIDLFTFKQAQTIIKKTGLSLLSKEEWEYLLTDCATRNNGNFIRRIADVNCLILTPENFTGKTKEKYTADEWKTAENSGLVAFPCAGQRTMNGLDVIAVNKCGLIWSSSTNPNGLNWSYNVIFNDNGGISVERWTNDNGCSVRLVKIQ